MIMMKIHDSMHFLLEITFLILKVIYFTCESIFLLFLPTTRKSVAGEIVLVTGAGHGIGKELAIGYASLGATVVCWDINEETNKQTVDKIKMMMGKNTIYSYKCNVADKEEVFRVAEKVRKEVGDVTILVNNAGILIAKKLLSQSADEITRVIDVNLKSHYWTLQAFLPSMIEKNHGHVVALSSLTAFWNATHSTVYCPSKSAIKALMEAISNELRTYSKGKSLIKFTTVYPTLVLTGIVKMSKLRFRSLTQVTPQKTASLIIDAQRRNVKETSTPSYLLLMLYLLRMLPDKAFHCVYEFLGTHFDVED